MGTHDFKYNNVPLFAQTEILSGQKFCLDFFFILFDEEYLNSIRDFFLAQSPVNINVSRSPVPKLALVPVSRYTAMYTSHTLMSVPIFIRIERGSDGGL